MSFANSRVRRYAGLIALTISLGLWFSTALIAQTNCTYYASPDGGGDGINLSSPFQIANFWSVARPGYTLCLLSGRYTGQQSMITPPPYVDGTADGRITVSAISDGSVLIDGEGYLQPVLLETNDYWTIEGINAANSGYDTVVGTFPGSDNNIIRRVVAWNAADNNSSAFIAWGGYNNLFEDVAGFGTARKIFQSYESNQTVFRRAWGMWNFSGPNTPWADYPKGTFSLAYDSFNNICDNCIATADFDPGTSTSNFYGLLGANQLNRYSPDGNESNHFSNSGFFGSIAYSLSTQSAEFMGALQGGQAISGLSFNNVAVYVETSNKTTSLGNLYPEYGGPSYGGHRLTNVTEIHTGSPDRITDTDWISLGNESFSSVGEASNIWNGYGTEGARICYRYENGALSNVPLWPWPMNQRIIEALGTAGRRIVDITQTMSYIFGPISGTCWQ